MNEIALLIYAALLIEAIVTLADSVIGKELDWKYLASLGVGLAVAILVTVNYDLDLFAFAGFEGQWPIVGPILSGIIYSRGANIVADLLKVLVSFRKAA